MRRKRILLADDHREILLSIRDWLLSEYEVVDMVQNGRELVRSAQISKPDLIITDISMPLMTGLQAAANLRELGVASPIIFLTTQSSRVYVKRALKLGVKGYVLKAHASEQLGKAILEVLAGRTFVSPQIGPNAEKIV